MQPVNGAQRPARAKIGNRDGVRPCPAGNPGRFPGQDNQGPALQLRKARAERRQAAIREAVPGTRIVAIPAANR
jgi:hypothetical protein